MYNYVAEQPRRACNVVWEGQDYHNWTGCQGRGVAGPNLAATRRKGHSKQIILVRDVPVEQRVWQ